MIWMLDAIIVFQFALIWWALRSWDKERADWLLILNEYKRMVGLG